MKYTFNMVQISFNNVYVTDPLNNKRGVTNLTCLCVCLWHRRSYGLIKVRFFSKIVLIYAL